MLLGSVILFTKWIARALGKVLFCFIMFTVEKTVPIYCKAKSILKVCHSAKAAETRNLVTCKDDSLFFASQVSQLLYGNLCVKIPVAIFTDSIPLLESIGSTKQIEEKMLRMELIGVSVKNFAIEQLHI